MSKKVFSVILVAVMVVSMFCIAGISASAFGGGTIYAELPDTWAKAAKAVYCHVWENGADELYAWQTKNEKMEQVEGNKYSYEIPSGNWNMIIISIDTGMQTYDLTFGDPCVGDTILIDPDTPIENPMDSNKSAARATWQNNSTDYGPHFAITSIGSVVGEVLAPGEDAKQVLEAFKTNYPDIATAELVAELEQQLGIDSADAGSSDTASGGDADTTSSGGSTASGTSSTASGTSSGATSTGDSTPYVVLAVVLVAALGVAVIAAKKKTTAE